VTDGAEPEVFFPGSSRLVFPLDVPDLDEARDWVRLLSGRVGVFKVGLELFTATGPASVAVVREAGAACFLDLKLHDIPATMAGAVRRAADLGVRFLTVHTAAGPRALRAAAEAAAGSGTTLLGVTVLTSLDDDELQAIGLPAPAEAAASRLGALARQAGVPGIVCSAHELPRLRRELGPEVVLVVPGIRPAGDQPGDQRRVATPVDAVRAGADLLVVGRPIRNAADPVAAAAAIAMDIESALPDPSALPR
jgi:orotidine-5'-phosphate decarboxylase